MEEKKVRKNMRKALCTAMIALSTGCFVGLGHATEADRHGNNHIDKVANTPHLSPDLKVILLQEMNAIERGMMKIIPAIASGDWQSIANVATKIKKSFILKQKLSKKQRKKLHRSLPKQFVEMDHYFHATAGKLADAALQHDAELVNFYFYRLNSQCVNCHSRYATDRFSNFKNSM